MVRLREIPRTAAFAWSPDSSSPWIATGTKSGTVDIDFSNETCLELWDLGLDNTLQQQELQPTITVPTESGFHDLAWTHATEGRKKGIIAGGLESGSLGLWDVDQLLANSSSASLYNEKIHSGAVKALQFNPKISNFLATGGVKGELFISDINHLGSPIRLGSTAARADDIECLDWNKKVSNILVTGSSGGFVTVWDMKVRRESLTLNNYGRKAASAIAWDPTKPTRLITAVPLEQDPVILVWDLRNSNAPEKIMKGHDSGVLSLSWCPQDHDLLLSCGKDNRTILWNPQTGQAYGDYPEVTNWTFQTRWNPHNPNLFATASLDGKIQIQTLQNTNPRTAEPSEQTQVGDGEDFFARAPMQPQSSSFSPPKAPKWLERPVSVSFGFGGRIISVKPSDLAKSKLSTVTISKFEVDSNVGQATESFESAIDFGDLNGICQQRVENSKSDNDKADWKVIQTLVSTKPREELIKYLGFGDVASDTTEKSVDDAADSRKPSTNGVVGRHKRFQSFFESTPDGDFLSELAATKGTRTNNPFQLYTGAESDADQKITHALILGQFDKALDVCLAEDRMSDAFMVAICGGEECTKRAQEAYFAKQSGGPNYLRLLASVVGKNLWDTVHNADLANWREVMTTLCTFADEQEFPDLCEALGDRLEEQISDTPSARKDAAFCYLAGSKLEKVVAIWVAELKENEDSSTAGGDATSAFSLHAQSLQNLIEKVTVFRKVVNFRDGEISKAGDWKLENLYTKYLEYADIVAGHGQLAVSQKYLDMIPQNYPGADVARSRVQQARKKSAAPAAAIKTQIPGTTPKKTLPMSAGYAPTQNIFTPVPPSITPAYGVPAPALTPSAPSMPQMNTPANPYAPSSSSIQANPYAPAGGYQPMQPMRTTPAPPPMYGVPAPNPIAPPPRQYNQSPSIPPPSKDKNMPNWNDIPEGFVKPPTSRRATPSVPSQPPTNPYAPQGNFLQSPPAATGPPSTGPPPMSRQKTPAPPPPKGMAPPPRVSSPLTSGIGAPQYGDRPGSAGTNPYAPPAAMTSPPPGIVAAAQIPRGASPYNAPPAAAPPPNRYAPAPGSQATQQKGRPAVAPPPQQSSFKAPPPVANPYSSYASQPQQLPPQQALPSQPPTPFSYAPMQTPQQAPFPSTQQPIHPPPTGPPKAAAPPAASIPDAPIKAAAAPTPPPARKYPKGDRSHIPPAAEPIVTILTSEMQRVKSRAPASFKAHVADAEKRLDMLFDHLNNEELIRPDTIEQLVGLATALQNRDFQRASEIQMDVYSNKVEECGQWMVGVKRLVGMCKATP